MPVMYNTGDWFTLRTGSTYRKFEIYNFDGVTDIDLKYMKVYAAPFGGPIAIIRDSKQILLVKGNPKAIIKIVNATGSLISIINWNHGNLITMGWSDSEELLCVKDDGLVVIYDMFGNEIHTFSMGQEANDTKVIDAKIYASNAGTGVAVMTTSFRIFVINNIRDPKNRQLPEIINSALEPTCWDIITEERNTFGLVCREKEVVKLVQGDNRCEIVQPSIDKPYKNITNMAVSYNHRYLALYTNNGIIWLGTSDMKTKFCEFETGKSFERPLQIEWILDAENCRQSDAIIITYPSLLLVINTNGDQNMYTYDSAIFLIPEMDGVRIITNACHEMIQKVPQTVYNIFAINSQEPSSFLFEAHKKFQEKSHQSDEYLGLFKDKLQIAVNDCIEAAGYEFDTETQKSLIRTAYFGKGFIASHNPDQYVHMSRILRVLNGLRDSKVGLPLTFKQFSHLKPNVILDRLVFQKHYAIAIQVAKYLKLSESRILEHWAFHKVMYDKNEGDVARKITEKFKNPTVQGVSFCNIAEKAHNVGKNDLAIKLLELEPKASLQVPLLLKLGEGEKALYSATRSGDTNLVYMVLLELKETTPMAKFQMIIRKFTMAQNLYKKYCQMYNKAALQDLFNVEDDFLSRAEVSLREAINNPCVESYIPIAAVAYNEARKAIESELCSDVRNVSKQQKILSDKYTETHGIQFYGLTIHDTLKSLVTLGELKLAEKFRNEFKISEKRYWWIRIQILSEQFRWEELDKFAKSKKSPIGYEPFVEVCLKQNNIHEAKKYILKCRDDKRIKWYLRSDLLESASAVAFEQRDLQTILTIHLIATNKNDQKLVEELEYYINQLSMKK